MPSIYYILTTSLLVGGSHGFVSVCTDLSGIGTGGSR